MIEDLPFISYIVFFIWFIFLLLLSFITERVWARIFPGMKYRFFIAPGVIVHELSHALACLLFLAPIYKVSFFSREGGFVQHGRSRFGFLGNTLIAMAPIFGIALFLWAVIYWFGYSLEIKTIDFSASGIWPNISLLFSSAWELIKTNAATWQFWVFAYLVVSLVSALAPSKKDFQNAFWGLIAFFLVGLVIFYFGLDSHFIVNLVGKYLGYVISLGVMWQIIALVIGLPIYLIRKIF